MGVVVLRRVLLTAAADGTGAGRHWPRHHPGAGIAHYASALTFSFFCSLPFMVPGERDDLVAATS